MGDVERVLKAAGAELNDADLAYLFEEVERIASMVKDDRNWPAGEETMFRNFISMNERHAKKVEKGGRPIDRTYATAMHCLADLYIQMLGGQFEAWEISFGTDSHFPAFAAAALAPVLGNRQEKLIPRLAKYWERERRKIQPL